MLKSSPDPWQARQNRLPPANRNMMSESNLSKSVTRQLLIFDSSEDLVRKHLAGREASPELRQFLKTLLKGTKWPGKINIPSGHDNLAAGQIFSSRLRQGILEVFSEVHVFLEGVTLVEKWPILGETDRISSLPKETFTATEIEKVRLIDDWIVQVRIKIPARNGTTKTVVRMFDFSGNQPGVRFVPNPLLCD